MRGITLLTLVLVVVACASSAPEPDARAAQLSASKHRAAAQIEAGEFKQAAEALEALAREVPKDSQVFVMLGDAYRGSGDFDAAVKNYTQAIRLNYDDYLPHLKLGTLLMENGKTGRALTEFEVAVKFGDEDALTHYNYGLALDELGRGEQALSQWRIAQDRDPSSPVYAAAVGMGLAGVDDTAAAESFERARVLGADDAAFHNNYALVLERLGRFEEARSHFKAAVARSDREQYRYNLALNSMRTQRFEEARQEWRELIETEGVHWSYAVYLAIASVSLERYDDAIAALEPFSSQIEAGEVLPRTDRVDRVPPTVSDALSALGMAWRGKHDLPRARECLRRAVDLEPRNPSYLNNYGVVLAESGMLAEAREQWRRALEIDPANATARANLSAYER